MYGRVEELLGGPAEHPVPHRVDALEVAVEAGDAEHVERQPEESIELVLRAPPIDEHPDLVADRRQHRQEAVVRRANLAAEELHDAEHLAAQQHREAERRVQPFASRHVGAREIRVLRDVGNPGRLARMPRRDRAGRRRA